VASEQLAVSRIHGSAFICQRAARSKPRWAENEALVEAVWVERELEPRRTGRCTLRRRACNEVTISQISALRPPLRTKPACLRQVRCGRTFTVAVVGRRLPSFARKRRAMQTGALNLLERWVRKKWPRTA